MKLLRRQFLLRAMGATIGAAMVPARVRWALAETYYPSRPVHILVGYAAGGVSDILARLIAKQLSDRLSQAFVIENRPGAGGNLAADQVVHAAPDGYTLLLAGMANAINVSIFPDLDFNFARDMAPVAVFARSPMVMEVNPAFPAKTVLEFIAYAKAHPGAIANAAVNASVADPAFKAQLSQVGNAPLSETPADFGKLIAADSAKWAKVVRFAAISPQ